MPPDDSGRKFQKELNSGAVSLVLLSVLQRNGEPMYGYEIAKYLESAAQGALPMNQAAIYPVLRSLEKQQLLRSRMVASESGPPRKYYQLTAAGRRAFDEWKSAWMKTTSFVNSLLETSDVESDANADAEVPRATGAVPETKERHRR
ncbi:PadR family transcriptional regulator [Novipirellula artificiosorum]|uniref:Lineage-specific thermal regulator protein n=1 Tax=Novipirellula artificiosorum TaxID=2528016 RepID=A0A5C6DPR1_9BACT|nr:PadR family transcriptional regulator [Novipirellula artificiosorum]TWU38592.1 lineage-specific thermal regulator protein [Novipirellula artificiosorum]